jgi:hypothetical protein
MTAAISLSIIVPAYNVQHYIRSSVGSILGQMRASHELIVIDDGSTDDTHTLLTQLQAEWAGTAMSVVTQANLGVAAARNHGLRLARGAYVAFVDSDDILLPGSLAAIEAVIVRQQPDVITCDLRTWFPEREHKSRLVQAGYPADTLVTDRDTMLRVYFRDRHMYVWSKIFKREIYQQLPAPVFPLGRVFEDVTAVPLLLARCATLYYLPHCIIDYRQRPTSISKTMTQQACLNLATALLPARAQLAEIGVDEATRLQFDIALSHIYLGIVKDSYRLAWRSGAAVRQQARAAYLDGLFHASDALLGAMARTGAGAGGEGGLGAPNARQRQQLRAALAGSLWLDVAQTVGGRLRAWRDARRG